MGMSDLFKKKSSEGQPEKVTDQTFQAEVLSAGAPVLVDFWASWCAPCRLLGGLLEEVAPEFAGRMRVVKLNVDENPQTAAQYGVRSIPTMIFFRGGQEAERVVGVLPLNPLRQKIESHLLPTASPSDSVEANGPKQKPSCCQ